MEKNFTIEVTYSDAIKTYTTKAVWVEGRIISGFDGIEILAQNGAWLLEDGQVPGGQGWIYFSENLNILEKNIEGCISIEILENNNK